MSDRPLIMVAMAEPLRSSFLDQSLLEELSRFGEVAFSRSPDDLLSPAARVLLVDAAVIITGWGTGRIGPEVLAAAVRLRGVVHTAGSVRAYVAKECYDRGIVVSSQAWANAVPVAEYTLAMILLAAKGVFSAQREYRSTRSAYRTHDKLAERGAYGIQVGVIGASTVGRRVLALLGAFELRIALADPTVSAAEAGALGAELMSLDELMTSSAVVSLRAWLPSTEGMIGATQLAALPDGAVFINTARGALVDEWALVAELRSGRIEAVVDVTWPEIPEPDSELWDLPNLTLTPHLAGSSGNELRRMGASAVRETGRILRREPLRHGVDLDRYDEIA